VASWRSGLPAAFPIVQFLLATPVLLQVGAFGGCALVDGCGGLLRCGLRVTAGGRLLLGAHGQPFGMVGEIRPTSDSPNTILGSVRTTALERLGPASG
jgi:hypothetical protein